MDDRGTSSISRQALDSLPLPCLVFEPSQRLNFVNRQARNFFGIGASSHGLPESNGVGADQLFDKITFGQSSDAQDLERRYLQGERIDKTFWDTEQHVLVCNTRPNDGSTTVKVSVKCAVSSFVPSADYFMPAPGTIRSTYSTKLTSQSPSVDAQARWHIVTFLEPVFTNVSPASPNIDRRRPAPNYYDQKVDDRSASPLALFAANAGSRLPPDLTAAPRMRPALTASSSTSSQEQQESFFPPVESIPTEPKLVAGVPAPSRPKLQDSPAHSVSSRLSLRSSLASGSSGSSNTPTSIFSASSASVTSASSISSYPKVSESFAAASTQSSDLSLELPPLPQLPASDSLDQTTSEPSTSLTSPPSLAAALVPSHPSRPLGSRTTSTMPSRPPVRPPYKRSKTSSSAAASFLGRPGLSSAQSDYSSPESQSSGATARPLRSPSEGSLLTSSSSPPLISDILSAHRLPILTRAVLAHLPKTGLLVASADMSGGYVNDVARELLMGVKSLRDFDEDNALHLSGEDENRWLEDGVWLAQRSPGGRWTWEGAEFFKEVRTEKSDKGAETDFSSHPISFNVAQILQRSAYLTLERNESQKSAADPSTSGSAQPTKTPPEATSKPYRTFDATFTQRILDPLDPLLDMVAKRGELPEQSLGGLGSTSGIVIGIEVEVPESSTAALGSFTRVVGMPATGASSVSDSTVSKRRIRRRVIELSGIPIRKPDGSHIGGMLVLRDITDDRKVPAVASASYEVSSDGRRDINSVPFLKHLLDGLPQMVWTTTPMGSHDYFNSQWYDYTGLEPEQSLGLGWQNPFASEDMPAAIKAWSHSLATGDPYSVEYRCRRFDGAYRWMLGRALPLRTSDGNITGWLGTCTDVDDFVHVRHQLVQAKNQVKMLIQHADLIMIAVDLNEKITFLSMPEALKAAQNFDDAEAIVSEGTSLCQFVGFKECYDADGLKAKIDSILTQKESLVRYECNFFDKRWQASITALRSGGNKPDGAIVICTDISNLRHAEQASRQKTEFLSTMNHELRTPVAGLIGMAELLLDDPTLGSSQRDSVQKIMRSAEIMLGMIGAVLDMSKIEAGKLDLDIQPFRLEACVEDARLYSFTAQKKGLRYSEEVQALPRGTLLGDQARIRQILANFLSNACRFTSTGSITFGLAHEPAPDNKLLVTFSVRDTGVGIPRQALSKLFQPFQQADATTFTQFGGTGLGLHISKSLTKLMHGEVYLESEAGQGTTAYLKIAFARSAPSPRQSQQANTPPLSDQILRRDQIWILVAEDNDINREIAVRLLQKMRFNVKAVIDGKAAVEAARERRWDLILMDGMMPTMDGFEATRIIRASADDILRQTKIVALTASAIAGDRQRFLDSGMDDYLAKCAFLLRSEDESEASRRPVRAQALEAMVIKHLAGLS